MRPVEPIVHAHGLSKEQGCLTGLDAIGPEAIVGLEAQSNGPGVVHQENVKLRISLLDGRDSSTGWRERHIAIEKPDSGGGDLSRASESSDAVGPAAVVILPSDPYRTVVADDEGIELSVVLLDGRHAGTRLSETERRNSRRTGKPTDAVGPTSIVDLPGNIN